MRLLDLLLLLAQGDPRVVRVPIPDRLWADPPAAQAKALEHRAGRPLQRTLTLEVERRVLTARAGGVLLKRYLVGIGSRLELAGGGVYALDRSAAYVLDPAGGALTVRDRDARELRAFERAGAKIHLLSPGGGFARSGRGW